MCVYLHRCVDFCVCLRAYVHLFVCLSVCAFVCVFMCICRFVYLFVQLFIMFACARKETGLNLTVSATAADFYFETNARVLVNCVQLIQSITNLAVLVVKSKGTQIGSKTSFRSRPRCMFIV